MFRRFRPPDASRSLWQCEQTLARSGATCWLKPAADCKGAATEDLDTAPAPAASLLPTAARGGFGVLATESARMNPLTTIVRSTPRFKYIHSPPDQPARSACALTSRGETISLYYTRR